jgi:hypothetical protein
VQAVTGHANEIFFNLHVRAERLHAAESAVAVGGQREVGHFGGAFGDASEHGVTMGDGFVARRNDAARDDFGWMNCLFAQGSSLRTIFPSWQNSESKQKLSGI